jgi:3',5'-cyclic AMP phosphodiesterase CpdA
MKIIHISDLHIDAVNKPENYKRAAAALEYITGLKADHIVITGDITQNADKESFELARKLFKKFNLLNSKKLSLVIGNHDIFGGVHFAEDIIQYPKQCLQTDYKEKVRVFKQYFTECFEDIYQPAPENIYPYAKEFDDCILFGINTIAKYSIVKNPFASNGEVDKKQYEHLERILSLSSFKNKRKIILSHHHFAPKENTEQNLLWKRMENQTMKLRKKKKLVNLFAKFGVELVLHGHVHEVQQYERKGITFINSGGSVLNSKNEIFIVVIDTCHKQPIINIKSKKLPSAPLFLPNINITPKILSGYNNEIYLN